MTARKLIAGNWKMYGDRVALAEIDAIAIAASGHPHVEVLVCPPFTLLALAEGRGVATGGQDCHPAAQGAHTGCISAAMLRDAGADYCIVGHSERRQDQGETDDEVRAKAQSVQAAGLTPIVCVGETLEQREAGRAVDVVAAQLRGSLPPGGAFVVAYEPVWAIGTGRTPSAGDVAEMHAAIRAIVGEGVRILYGGSVKPANARELLAIENVNGALVGGASLTAEQFLPIVIAASRTGAEARNGLLPPS